MTNCTIFREFLPGGMEAFCAFLRGGRFALVDGETTDLEGGNDEQAG